MLWPDAATQLPPMFPAEVNQHDVTQIESGLTELPNYPVDAPVQNGGSSVQCGRGRGKAWTEEEHSFLLLSD
ncbi:Myb protein J [Spatholobus suberectus]|nr:Myb protein J [Spatholobus suberectus]